MQTFHQSIVKLGKNIFTISKIIMARVKMLLYSVWYLFQGVRFYLISCFQMGRVTGAYQFLRSFKKNLKGKKFLTWISKNYSYGIVFSYYPSVHCFDFLAGIHGKFRGKDKKFYPGQYLFTIDWAHPETNILNTEHSEIPQEHKCAHILALDNGNYAAQPNNRILWHVNSYTTDTSWPDYKVQTTVLGSRRI